MGAVVILGLSWFEELNLSFVCVDFFGYPLVVFGPSSVVTFLRCLLRRLAFLGREEAR